MSDTASFHSAHSSPRSASPPAKAAEAHLSRSPSPSDSIVRFTPEEEAELIASSNAEKATANALYGAGELSAAVGAYDHALSFLPAHLDYEIAVLKSNVAACHLRLAEWKQAAAAADAALDGLERVVPSGRKRKKRQRAQRQQAGFEWRDTGEGERPLRDEDEEDDVEAGDEAAGDSGGGGALTDDAVVELEGDEDEAARKLAALQVDDERREQVANLRAKSLLRRAKANVALGGWSNLASAEEDYKDLVKMPNLPTRDRAFVGQQLRVLPPRIQVAREKEMGEMMGKLKELGNGILKPFGLSTDNFKMQKDEKTGGYSMSFN